MKLYIISTYTYILIVIWLSSQRSVTGINNIPQRKKKRLRSTNHVTLTCPCHMTHHEPLAMGRISYIWQWTRCVCFTVEITLIFIFFLYYFIYNNHNNEVLCGYVHNLCIHFLWIAIELNNLSVFTVCIAYGIWIILVD